MLHLEKVDIFFELRLLPRTYRLLTQQSIPGLLHRHLQSALLPLFHTVFPLAGLPSPALILLLILFVRVPEILKAAELGLLYGASSLIQIIPIQHRLKLFLNSLRYFLNLFRGKARGFARIVGRVVEPTAFNSISGHQRRLQFFL